MSTFDRRGTEVAAVPSCRTDDRRRRARKRSRTTKRRMSTRSKQVRRTTQPSPPRSWAVHLAAEAAEAVHRVAVGPEAREGARHRGFSMHGHESRWRVAVTSRDLTIAIHGAIRAVLVHTPSAHSTPRPTSHRVLLIAFHGTWDMAHGGLLTDRWYRPCVRPHALQATQGVIAKPPSFCAVPHASVCSRDSA